MSNSEILDGLSKFTRPDGLPALCLVTGATGYIGGRLIPQLLEMGYRVRVLVRNENRLKQHSWYESVEVIDGDANSEEVLSRALQGVDVAYYLIHSLMVKGDFEKSELELAEKFARQATLTHVSRIVYLGGIVSDSKDLSPHMSARISSGEILRASGLSVIELRAGVVIGSGSASFEMLRYLTERLPIMTTPKWVKNRIQPIAVRDVLRYLVGAAGISKDVSGTFDIGGPEVFSYLEMMKRYANAAGLRKRIIFTVPVLTPRLSSGWVGLVTPVPFTLAKRLVESLKHEVVAAPSNINELIPPAKSGLTEFDRAVKLALAKIKDAQVETSWSNASLPGSPSDPLPTDPDWAGGSLYKDVRVMTSKLSLEETWAKIESIGGDSGYSTATWAWQLRGFIDKLFGGVGLRRGRRDPNHLMVGDAVDFWRVEDLIPNKLLRLRAEMKMPGLAWLEFKLENSTERSEVIVTQTATYAPRGLFGHVYWWLVYPMHGLVFPSMVKNIAGISRSRPA
ncbi:MAG: SDR family oxidoreductase [Rhodoluna sp.]